MSSRELVNKTLSFLKPERVPRQLWLLPWAEKRFPAQVAEIRRRFPDDIVMAPAVYERPPRILGDRYSKGDYVDEWGCYFSNPQDGIIGIVRKPLIADWKDVDTFFPPEEVLSLNIGAVNEFCDRTDRFVLSGSIVRPFERLQFLRTMEQALMDVLEQPPELFRLLEVMHEFYCREVEIWAQTEVDGIALMDDWGSQQGLLTPPEVFRDIFKPMYRDYVNIAKRRGKSVFLHSDGNILEIIPDLIEVGINALNSQIFCMGLEELGRRFRGRITFWGEIDRQYLLSQGTEEEIRRAVRDIHRNLYADGGVVAQMEFGLEARPGNITAALEAWNSVLE